LRDRGRDAAKILEFDVGVPSGLEAHLGVSHVAEFGLGWYSGRRWGLRDGGFVTLDEDRAEFGVPILYLHEVQQYAVAGSMPGRGGEQPLQTDYSRFPLQWFSGQLLDRDPLDLHIGATAVFVSGGFSFRTLALGDFLLGWFGVDFRRDDLAGVSQEDLLADLTSPDALARRRAVELLQVTTGMSWPEYRTPPKRDLFPREEREVMARIEEEVRGRASSPSAAHAVAPGISPAHLREDLPAPVEASPTKCP
jgi:hypothetical protein